MPATRLNVSPWLDPVIDARGHRVSSAYVELFWLPVLGPTATLTLRRLAAWLAVCPEGFSMDLHELSGMLGLGSPDGTNAQLPRAIKRCVRFSMVRPLGEDEIAVRRVIGPLPRHHLSRLPPLLQSMHDRYVSPATTDGRVPPASGPWPTADRRAG